MKITRLSVMLAVLAAAGFLFVSCGDNGADGGTTVVPPPPPLPPGPDGATIVWQLSVNTVAQWETANAIWEAGAGLETPPIRPNGSVYVTATNANSALAVYFIPQAGDIVEVISNHPVGVMGYPGFIWWGRASAYEGAYYRLYHTIADANIPAGTAGTSGAGFRINNNEVGGVSGEYANFVVYYIRVFRP